MQPNYRHYILCELAQRADYVCRRIAEARSFPPGNVMRVTLNDVVLRQRVAFKALLDVFLYTGIESVDDIKTRHRAQDLWKSIEAQARAVAREV